MVLAFIEIVENLVSRINLCKIMKNLSGNGVSASLTTNTDESWQVLFHRSGRTSSGLSFKTLKKFASNEKKKLSLGVVQANPFMPEVQHKN